MLSCRRSDWLRCATLFGVVLLLALVAVDGWAVDAYMRTSASAENYAFPYLSPVVDQRRILINAFSFQMSLFGAINGTGATPVLALRYLAMAAVLVGALMIFFNPKHRKIAIIAPWLLLVVITVLAPYGSKLLFYPLAESGITRGLTGEEAKTGDCMKFPDTCGFTPQLAGVHVASILQLTFSDLFNSRKWSGLIEQANGLKNLGSNFKLSASPEWLARSELYGDACGQSLHDWTNIVKYRQDGTAGNGDIPNAKILARFGSEWRMDNWMMTDIPSSLPIYPPRAIVLYDTLPTTDEWKDPVVQADYLNGLTQIYQAMTQDLKTVTIDGAVGSVTLKAAMDALEKAGLFKVTEGSNSTKLGPGFFFFRDKSTPLDIIASRALYKVPYTDTKTVDLTLMIGQRDSYAKLFDGSSGRFGYMGTGWERLATSGVLDPDNEIMKKMPVGVMKFTISGNGTAVPEDSMDCMIEGNRLINEAVEWTLGTAGRAKFMEPLKTLLIEKKEVPAMGADESRTLQMDDIFDNSLFTTASSWLVDRQYVKDEPLAQSIIDAFDVAEKDRRNSLQRELTEKERYEVLLKMMMEGIESSSSMHPFETKQEAQATRDTHEVRNVGMGWFTDIGGAGATFFGTLLTKVAATFTGPLSAAIVYFLSVLVDMALLILIVLTPILFFIGLAMPGAAAGVLTIATMGAFILKTVPITLLVLNNIGGMIYDMLGAGAGESRGVMQDMMIIAMAGLYANIVGLTFFLLFKLGDPATVLSRFTALDSSAKEVSERGYAATIAAATLAATAGAGAAMGGIGSVFTMRNASKAANALGMSEVAEVVSAAQAAETERKANDKRNEKDNKGGGPVPPGPAVPPAPTEPIIGGSGGAAESIEPLGGLGLSEEEQKAEEAKIAEEARAAEEAKAAEEALIAADDMRIDPNGLMNFNQQVENHKDLDSNEAARLELLDKGSVKVGDKQYTRDKAGNITDATVSGGKISGGDVTASEQVAGAENRAEELTQETPQEQKQRQLAEQTAQQEKILAEQAAAAGKTAVANQPAQAPTGPVAQQQQQQLAKAGGEAGVAVASSVAEERNDLAGGATQPQIPAEMAEGAKTPASGMPPVAQQPQGTAATLQQMQQQPQESQIPPTGGKDEATGDKAGDTDGAKDVRITGGKIDEVGKLAAGPTTSAETRTEEIRTEKAAQDKILADERLQKAIDSKDTPPELKESLIAAQAQIKGKTAAETNEAYEDVLRANGTSGREMDRNELKRRSLNDDMVSRLNTFETTYEKQLGEIKRKKSAGEKLTGDEDKILASYDNMKAFDTGAATVGEISTRLGTMGKLQSAMQARGAADLLGKGTFGGVGGFGYSMMSGLYGAVSGAGGGLAKIPVIGPAITESLNEFYQAPERAKAWKTTGGFGKWMGVQGDAQRMGFYQKEMAPIGAAAQYNTMAAQGAFQAQADMARQAAVEAVSKSRTQWEAMQSNRKDQMIGDVTTRITGQIKAEIQAKIPDIKIADLDKMVSERVETKEVQEKIAAKEAEVNNTYNTTTSRNGFSAAMNAGELYGLGRQEAADRVTSVRAESFLMTGSPLMVKRVKGGLTADMKLPENAEVEMEEVSVVLTADLLNKVRGDLNTKKLTSGFDEMMISHYGLAEKQYLRGDAEWNSTRNLTRNREAANAFSRKDVSTDYLVGGHMKMVQGKEKFLDNKGQYETLVKFRNESNQIISNYAAKMIEKAGGTMADAMKSVDVSKFRDGAGNALNGSALQVNQRLELEKMAFKELKAQNRYVPLNWIFEEAQSSGAAKYQQKAATARYNVASENAEIWGKTQKAASAAFNSVLGDVKNFGKKLSFETDGIKYDIGNTPDRLFEKFDTMFGNRAGEAIQIFNKYFGDNKDAFDIGVVGEGADKKGFMRIKENHWNGYMAEVAKHDAEMAAKFIAERRDGDAKRSKNIRTGENGSLEFGFVSLKDEF